MVRRKENRIEFMTEQEILDLATRYFSDKVFENHKVNVNKNHTKLKSYKINPILVRYLSKVLEGEYTALGVAKALYYPRVLSTSITTSFGTRIQNMFVELALAEGSLIQGMDIEFIDKTDNRRKWCQLKAGPNTINSEDVDPLLKKFQKVANLARTNNADLSNSDLIVGVLYGTHSQLSQHYRKIDLTYPVYAGADFWTRITGYSRFYDKLVVALNETIDNFNTEGFFESGYQALALEVEESELFDFS
jgi:hypothetical protein